MWIMQPIKRVINVVHCHLASYETVRAEITDIFNKTAKKKVRQTCIIVTRITEHHFVYLGREKNCMLGNL